MDCVKNEMCKKGMNVEETSNRKIWNRLTYGADTKDQGLDKYNKN